MSKPDQTEGHNTDSHTPTPTSKVAILGYGRFGRALAQLAQDSGLETSAYDPAAEVPVDLAAASPA